MNYDKRQPARATPRRAIRLERWLCLVVSALMILAQGSEAMARSAAEDELKASFLYRLAHFITWPTEALPKSPDRPLLFCVEARSSIRDELVEIVVNRNIHGRPVRVVDLNPTADFESRLCHVLFVGETRMDEIRSQLDRLVGIPWLTVGEADTFIASGGMVNLHLANRKLSLEINREVLEAAGLRAASQLLRLTRPTGNPTAKGRD